MKPVVAIIGRPNVGKSTLFNRLVGRRFALVDDRPGVTRDRREGEATLGDLQFTVIDTAGLEDAPEDSLTARMRKQTELAVTSADLCLFLVDARAGLLPDDHQFAEGLRRAGVPVIVIANKSEGQAGEAGAMEAYELGLGQPVPVSAAHGEGMSDLYTALLEQFQALGFDPAAEELLPETDVDVSDDGGEDAEGAAERDVPARPLQIAIVGRPNVGKSTLINALLGEDRVLTGPEPGITRDAIRVDLTWEGRTVRLVDTAGMRRKTRITDGLEKLSVRDTLEAVRFAEVVVLVMDAQIAFEKQDLQIAEVVEKEGRGLVIALNKWDLVEDAQERLSEARYRAGKGLSNLKDIPIVPLSAERQTGFKKLFKAVEEVHRLWNTRISTAALNRWLGEALRHHPPPLVHGRRLKFRYMTQVKTRPPAFALFSSRPQEVPEHYLRYLQNDLRAAFDLPAVPLRFYLRKPDNPYAKKT